MNVLEVEEIKKFFSICILCVVLKYFFAYQINRWYIALKTCFMKWLFITYVHHEIDIVFRSMHNPNFEKNVIKL